jgi:sigma-B regulation protein RsbU (phosphoserine phosphatase)
MKSFAVKSLRRRLIFFLLLPVACILIAIGILGFLYAHEIILGQWNEAAIAKLQRAAHSIDMHLGRPVEWIEMFHKTGGKRGDYRMD